jgi:hypothetical protein
MKQNTKTSKQAKDPEVNVAEPVVFQTGQDLKHSVLFLSVFINMFLFIGWLVAQTTDHYNEQIISVVFR